MPAQAAIRTPVDASQSLSWPRAEAVTIRDPSGDHAQLDIPRQCALHTPTIYRGCCPRSRVPPKLLLKYALSSAFSSLAITQVA